MFRTRARAREFGACGGGGGERGVAVGDGGGFGATRVFERGDVIGADGHGGFANRVDGCVRGAGARVRILRGRLRAFRAFEELGDLDRLAGEEGGREEEGA